MFGSGDYSMRVWLDPRRSPSAADGRDVVKAIREQNVQVAAGVIGAPLAAGHRLQLSVNAQGRLQTRRSSATSSSRPPDGAVTRLGHRPRRAGRVRVRAALAARQQAAVALPIFQAPGSNALQISDDVRKTMAELKRTCRRAWTTASSTTRRSSCASIEAVTHTLLEAIALVVLVVILFLQTWRASIIPLLAVPVSIVGTFGLMHAFGFSINALSLFGLVLAIGIVVDDAIVVVENVERNIEEGLSPRKPPTRPCAK
jgi:multidrug efflux pump